MLTIEKKIEIIGQLKKGVAATVLSERYDVPRTTINDLKKNADNILKFASQMESMDGRPKQRKTMKKPKNETLESALYLWFTQKRSEGIPLSGPIIAEKAKQFNEKLNGHENFKASVGWLDNFKNRHGIRELNIEGEKLSAASAETVSEFQKTFQKLIEENGFTPEQVFNADETGLNFKALPTKTLASCSEKSASGFKMQKQRITVMVCSNASGDCRLPLLLIGKSKKPRCFKGTNMNALPVQYYAQANAWMSQAIFTQWFHNIFVPHVQCYLKAKNLPQKAVLVLDNAPSHPEAGSIKSDDGNIFCYFLPANTTSVLQPMDQSVIETLKRRYRKKFIQRLIIEEEMSLIDYWKAYNLKHVVDNVSDAWNEVSQQTLKRAWHKLWPRAGEPIPTILSESVAVTNDIVLQSNDAFRSREFSIVLDRNEIVEWLQCDSAQVGYQLLTDDEIVQELIEEDTDADDPEGIDYDGSETPEVVTKSDLRKEAAQASCDIEKFIDWYSKQNDADCTDAMTLRRLRNFALKKTEIHVKQSKITEFMQEKNQSPCETIEDN